MEQVKQLVLLERVSPEYAILVQIEVLPWYAGWFTLPYHEI
jgi:hypothetical protein